MLSVVNIVVTHAQETCARSKCSCTSCWSVIVIIPQPLYVANVNFRLIWLGSWDRNMTMWCGAPWNETAVQTWLAAWQSRLHGTGWCNY